MTALKARDVDGFIAKGGGTAKAALIYGPDEGLVRERADALAKKITPDLKDAFNFIELTGDEIKADPPRPVHQNLRRYYGEDGMHVDGREHTYFEPDRASA